ncbi:serine/threonine-protein kinase [Sorangium atrum]|uniref:Protein kinase n=1 Tax=Sorangium atrum TaxID=2995308 RepID=A0ABT5BXG1_9BACT|nr:serine/threonine protein kinase [Sorangium aterium]MDC0678860.1 protein kinase [Sorangium aterium]
MQFAPDSVVGGKYRLERPLSHGGMGSVWVARHVNLGSLVAVKFMDPTYAASSTFLARFEREARIAASLQSPHVVYVQDFGVDDDTPYLVMELLQGEDLGTRLERVGRLSLVDATLILLQAGKAIRRAHDAGLVHRDLKPANLFLVRVEGEQDEVVKILDFGIVKETGAVLTEEVTRTGELLGSPHYMSPEQVRGEKDIDQRSDLWSLGVILFYGVTGELPFQGAQLGAVIANILVGPVPSASLIAPDLPPEIDAFFARALARERAERFQSIGEMMSELRRIAGTASPSIPDLQSPCSGVPSTARPRLSGTIALDAAQLDEPASAPRSAGPGTLTIAGSTAQEAGQQRPQRAMLVAGIAMTMLLGAGVTIAVGGGGASGGDGVGAKVASAGAPASAEVAASVSAEVGRSSEPLESVTPAVPAAEATGSAADAAGETAAPSTSTTAARPPSSATPRPPHTGVPAASRRPPIPPTTTPGLDRAPIPEVPF